jgi:glycerophosphoryl diester phosphodiesterase
MQSARIPKLIAHRGYARRYPENSLPALQAAVDAGGVFVEFDIQLSRDGVPVLLHDPDLMRTSGRPECVWELSRVELGKVSVGEPRRFGSRYAAVCVPSLAEVVEWWQCQLHLTAFVELKEESLQRFGCQSMLETVVEVLKPVSDRAVVISCNTSLVASAKRIAGMPVGWVVPEWNAASHEAAVACSPDYLFCNWKRFPPSHEPLWEGPWSWAAYEVTDPQQALALALRGVEYVETMAIGEMLKHPLFQQRPSR